MTTRFLFECGKTCSLVVSSYTTANTSFNAPMYETSSLGSSFNNSSVGEYATTGFEPPTATFEPPDGANPYPPNSEEYNPEQEPETWEPDANWTQPPLDTDTPESPPIFEKEGYIEGVEYHDNIATSGATDVDHRVLHPLSAELGKYLTSVIVGHCCKLQ
jgi:hypothetical protein